MVIILCWRPSSVCSCFHVHATLDMFRKGKWIKLKFVENFSTIIICCFANIIMLSLYDKSIQLVGFHEFRNDGGTRFRLSCLKCWNDWPLFNLNSVFICNTSACKLRQNDMLHPYAKSVFIYKRDFSGCNCHLQAKNYKRQLI